MKQREDFEIDIIEDDLDENHFDEAEPPQENGKKTIDLNSILYKGVEVPYLLLGLGILLLVAFFLVFPRSSGDIDSRQIEQLKTLIQQLDSKLIVLDSINQKLPQIQQLSNHLDPSKNRQAGSKNSAGGVAGVVSQQGTAGELSKPGRPRYHVVSAGDTLWEISRRYGLTVEKLRQINQLDRNAILHPGQRLVVTK